MNNIKQHIKWSALLVGHFLFLGLIGCKKAPQTEQVSLVGEAMGTQYHIKLIGTHLPDNLQGQIDSLLNDFNGALSTYDTSSVISKFNQNNLAFDFLSTMSAKEAWQRQQFYKVCYRSFDVYAASGGAFDPGAGPIYKAWGFAEQKMYQVPTASFIDSCLAFANLKYLELMDGIPTKKDKRLTLNFNAIAKGHGVDIVALFLEDLGIENYMVEIGGEVRCKGKNAKNAYWTIGINKPNEKSGNEEVQAMVSLVNKSMATSGNYRNYFEENGKKYAHTIDPRTGYPAKNELLSASIFAPDCMTADAYATACMVLGKTKCLALIESDSTLEAFLLCTDSTNQIEHAYTKGMSKWLVK